MTSVLALLAFALFAFLVYHVCFWFYRRQHAHLDEMVQEVALTVRQTGTTAVGQIERT